MSVAGARSGGPPARDLAGGWAGDASDLLRVTVLPRSRDDGDWTLQQLERVLQTPGVVFMLVLGDDERAAQVVGHAYPLCVGTEAPGRGPERRIIWIHDPGHNAVSVFLAMLLWLPLPRVAVLNARDWVRARIGDHEAIDEQALERAFRRG